MCRYTPVTHMSEVITLMQQVPLDPRYTHEWGDYIIAAGAVTPPLHA
jgi:hypothetical protein